MIVPRPALVLLLVLYAGHPLAIGETPTAPSGKPVYNSQPAGEEPGTPAEAVAAMTAPEGFEVRLFAGEPDVSQPVALATDARGRVWVAEFYTYAGRGFDGELRDRIVILQDTNGDGQHDRRTIFWDQGNRLTSVLPTTGGCWILNGGTLAWLADADGNDKADGPPQVLLDGFDQNQVGHNIVSGLLWGPDGWIYGRHGIQANSLVGPPDSPESARTLLNCAIWRYQPVEQRFEVVTAGTTNPWGLDYNAVGEFFFTNNVIGHGWHVIPGAHYRRMYGADFNPHFYELIDQHADHYHWDHAASWTDSREDNGIHGRLGGGHSHCGGMIYQGDNWPESYRGNLFMCNTHGRRVNQDIPVRHGSGYELRHGEDILFANQPWFRGVDLQYGPNGEVYLSDWTDLGECHDNDGVHRLSGRIYHVTYGPPEARWQGNLEEASDRALADLHTHQNEWFVRQARRILTERIRSGKSVDPSALATLNQQAMNAAANTDRLRAIWTLFSIDQFPEARQWTLLKETDEQLRVWGIRLLMNAPELSPPSIKKLTELAQRESSSYVRLYLTAALQRMPTADRWELARLLCSRGEDVDDHNIPLMLWYGIEPAVVAHPREAIELLKSTKIPRIRTFLARRLMHENESLPGIGAELVATMLERSEGSLQHEILTGMLAATSGWRRATPPAQWNQLSAQIAASADKSNIDLVQKLSVVFGDGRAMSDLRQVVLDATATPIDRVNALQILVGGRPEGTLELLQKTVADRVLEATAAGGLAAFDDPKTPTILINRYRYLKQEAQAAALNTLCSRPEYARALLEALRDNRLPEVRLSAAQARQIQSFENTELTALLTEIWGSLQSTDAQKLARIAELKTQLTPDVLAAADLSHGRLLYNKMCSSCHRLFDSGTEIGPTLTGSNRDNVDYLLENMIAPSAVVPKQYQISTVVLTSGRVLNGLIVTQTERTLTLQTEKEKLDIDQEEIELIKPSTLSLMPEGQLDVLTVTQIRDLVAYLQSPGQVPLPPDSPLP